METKRFIELKRFMHQSCIPMTRIVSDTTAVGDEDFKESYTKNFLAVCGYVAAVNKTGLPALKYPMPAWDEFSAALLEAKASALEWTNNIVANLKSLPHDILQKNENMMDLFDEAILLCTKLTENPRPSRIKELCDTIDDLLLTINSIQKKLANTLKILTEYHNSLPTQAKKLQLLANQSLKTKEVDEKKVEELRNLVSTASSEISSLNAAIAGMSIAIASSVFISVVAVAAAGPLGCLSFIFTGAVVGVSIAYIVIDSQKIKNLKEQINMTQNSMDEYTQDISTLKLLADGYNNLAKQAIEMENCMQFIISAWNAMRIDIQAIKSEIEHAQDLWTKQEWTDMQKDFEVATGLWKQFIEKTNLYDLNEVKACDCKLELGMNKDEVKNEVEKSDTIDLIEYLTA